MAGANVVSSADNVHGVVELRPCPLMGHKDRVLGHLDPTFSDTMASRQPDPNIHAIELSVAAPELTQKAFSLGQRGGNSTPRACTSKPVGESPCEGSHGDMQSGLIIAAPWQQHSPPELAETHETDSL